MIRSGALAAQVMLDIAALTRDGSEFAGFTFPRYREMLERPAMSCVTVGARWDGRPVGLALALWERDSPQVRLLSLMVAPEMRRCGIASQLLARCEMLAARTGRARIATYFSSILPEAAAFAATLATAGWSLPRMMELRYAARCTTFAAAVADWPAMRRRLCARDVTFEPWSDRSPVDEREIATLASSAECPRGLTPDQWEREFDDEASFVIRRSGQVVGWILARLDSPNEPGAPPVLFVPCAYIRRDLWRSGLLVLAYHFVACWHAERFGDEAVGRFSTAAQYPGMMALTRRRFAPAALWIDEWLRADKPLR